MEKIRENLIGLQHRLEIAAAATEADGRGYVRREAVAALAEAAEELDVAAEHLLLADERLAEERQRYVELFELAPDGYLALDGDGLIVEVNLAAARMLRVKPEHLRGKPFVVYLAREDRRRFHSETLRVVKEAGGVCDWEASLAPRDAPDIPVWLRCAASSGPQPVVRLVMRDLREHRRTRDAERADQAREADRLRAHASRLEDLERAKTHFLNLVSHELRAPLGLIRGYVSMMSDGSLGVLPSGAQTATGVMLAKCDEMARLVTDMLDTARLEEGRLAVTPRSVDLRSVVADAVGSMEPFADNAGRSIRVAPDEDQGEVVARADPHRVQTIITNLLDNALKYSFPESTVLCEVGGGRDRVTVAVTDRGPGMRDDQMACLFTRFGRIVTPETSHIGGTGLGLYLSRELARMQGGDLTVTSSVGVGSTFTLTLPRAAAPSNGNGSGT